MLTRKDVTNKFPEGFSDLLPEGICGIMEYDSPLDLAEATVKTTKKRKIKWQTLLTVSRTINKEILLDVPKARNTTRDTKPLLVSSNALGLNIDYKTLSLPDEIRQLDLTNVVEVQEDLLEKIASQTENLTKEMGEMILLKIAPLILAYESSINYVNAVMQDGFGIQFEEDPAVREGIKDITKMAMFEFIISHTHLEHAKKELLSTTFIEKQAAASVERMEILQRKSSNSEYLNKHLEAVLATRSSGKSSVAKPKEEGNTNV
jgi:hypothetical protein